MSSILDIGITSLYAAKQSLTIVNQNIANADNPYYTRRTADLSEINLDGIGGGVRLENLRRFADEVANADLIDNLSNHRFSELRSNYYTQLANTYDDPKVNLASDMNVAIVALNNLTTSASSIQLRQLYLTQLSQVTYRVNQMDASSKGISEQINKSLELDVDHVNQISENIAALNAKIVFFGADSDQSLSLLDQRDKLEQSLATYVNFDRQIDEKGNLNIQLNKGISLVFGSRGYQLESFTSNENPAIMNIGLRNGASLVNVTQLITSGEIGSSLAFQQHSIGNAERILGRLSLVFASTMNAQNRLGMDLNGQLGGDIFRDINDPLLTSGRVLPNALNMGGGDLSVLISDPSALTSSDYDLVFDTNTDYRIVRRNDGVEVTSGSVGVLPDSIDVEGFSVEIASGAFFVAGDKFILSPTRAASSLLQAQIHDGSKLALASPVDVSIETTNTGSGTITVTDITDVTTADFSIPGELNPPIRIDFITPTTYRLVNANDSSIIEDNLTYDPLVANAVFPTPGAYDPGYRVSLSGEMQVGDTFHIDYNLSGKADNRNGIKMAALFQNATLNDGSLNYTQAYRNLSHTIASEGNVASQVLEGNRILLEQSQQRRDAVAGVSLEEETMNLARFQQSYQASAQMLQVSRSMFDTILNLIRG